MNVGVTVELGEAVAVAVGLLVGVGVKVHPVKNTLVSAGTLSFRSSVVSMTVLPTQAVALLV